MRPLSNRGVSGEFRYLGSPPPFFFGADDAASERDGASARVADRDHQPPAKAIIGPAVAVGLDQQPGLDQFGGLVRRQGRAEPVAAVGREAQPERLAGVRADAAPVEIGARARPFDARQLLAEPRGRVLRSTHQPAGLLRTFARARIGGGQLHPGRLRQLLHRIHEGQAARLRQKPDRVAMRRTAEAVIERLLVIHVEGGRLLVMERAAALKFAASLLQFHRAADQRRQDGATAQFVEESGRQQAAAGAVPGRIARIVVRGMSSDRHRVLVP